MNAVFSLLRSSSRPIARRSVNGWSRIPMAAAPTLPAQHTSTSSLLSCGSGKDTPRSARNFSTSAENLSRIIAREHAEEVEGESTTMPTDLAELKKNLEKEWRIVDDCAITRMYKTVGAIKVQVSFHCQDTVEVTQDGAAPALDEEDGEEEENEIVDDEEALPIRFSTTLTKAGKTLVLACLSEDATVRIQSSATTTEDAEVIQAKAGTVGHNQYQGPEFTELAEDLQDAFHFYLEQDAGVNGDVAAFVSMYADFREQQQYVQFLEQVKSILD